MNQLKLSLPPNIYDILERCGLNTIKQILLLSNWDIKKVTNLAREDILLLKSIAADCETPEIYTSNLLLQKNIHCEKLSSGCGAIDKLLCGGFRKGTLTEIFGESGSGKTQIGLQTSLNAYPDGSVYICTEDLFPVNRFNQLKYLLPDSNPKIDQGKIIFVEHITEGHELIACLRVRLPKLLENNKISIIVIDSVAAPFRCEYTNYVQRAEDLRELAILLISLAQKYNLSVLCINQVTSSPDTNAKLLPALGLSWSNMISTRLHIKKTTNFINKGNDKFYIRKLCTVFAPDLPNDSVDLIITYKGLQEV